MTTLTPTPASISERTLTSRRLASLRSRLEHELAQAHELESELREEVLSSLESRRDTRTDDAGDPENATLAFEGAQTSAMLAQTTGHAAEIRAALERIELGTFGACTNCGGQIGAARLDARPASALCIDCANSRWDR
ncbi:MAG: TraR/DksA family transcriptional regulator [Salinibacterium sp.]|nr:MAG: TraR/DksA family transcriptional regulator [Salinibacterium sp.]